MEYADSILDTDIVYEMDGFKVLVDKKASLHMDGMEVDFVKENLSEGFKFNNPNESSACGCGESVGF